MKVSISNEEGTILVSHTVDTSRMAQEVIEASKRGHLTRIEQMRVVKNMLYDDILHDLENDLVTLILRGEK